jgi:hypothetical protein
MLKSTPPQRTPKGRIKKYLSYREAWSRIETAKDNGYYFEAVTLEESIICDRLISYLISSGVIDRPVAGNNYPSFGRLIGKCPEISTVFALKPAHLPPIMHIGTKFPGKATPHLVSSITIL